MADNKVNLIISAKDLASGVFKQVLNTTKSFASGVASQFDKMKSSILSAKGAIAALGVGLAVRHELRSFSKLVDELDELNKAAIKTGFSMEKLSTLDFAAKLSDVSSQGIQVAAKSLNAASIAAQQGSKEAAQAFSALGISLKELQTLNTDQLFDRVADGLARSKDGADKMVVAQRLLGRSYQELLPLIAGGAAGLEQARVAAEKYGVTITATLARNAEAMNDSMTLLQQAIRGVRIQLYGDVLEPLTAIFTGTANFIAKHRTEIADFIRGAAVGFWETVKDIAEFLGKIPGIVQDIGAAIFNAGDAILAWDRFLVSVVNSLRDVIPRALDLIGAKANEIIAQVKLDLGAFLEAIPYLKIDVDTIALQAGLNDAKTATTAAMSALSESIEAPKQELETFTKKFDVFVQSVQAIGSTGVADFFKPMVAAWHELEAEIKAAGSATEAFAVVQDRVISLTQQGQLPVKQFFESIKSGYTEAGKLARKFQKEMYFGEKSKAKSVKDMREEILNSSDPGDIWKGAAIGMNDFVESLDVVREAQMGTLATMNAMRDGWSSAISDMITGDKKFSESMKDTAKSVIKSLANMISQMLTAYAVKQLLIGVGLAVGGPVGGFVGGAAGAAVTSSGQRGNGSGLASIHSGPSLAPFPVGAGGSVRNAGQASMPQTQVVNNYYIQAIDAPSFAQHLQSGEAQKVLETTQVLNLQRNVNVRNASRSVR